VGRLVGRAARKTLAGRVALAIENAVLSAELSTTERQFEAILAGVDVRSSSAMRAGGSSTSTTQPPSS
jgi:GAF domain-containing protein